MTWWGWLIFGAYWLCALYAVPRIAYVITADICRYGGVDGAAVAFGYFISLVLCGAWPVLWGGYIWHRHARGHDYAGVLVAPRPIRRVKEREQMQRRIQDLERQVGIR